MIARRLLLATVGGGPFPTPNLALTALGHGGWTQKPKARALWHAAYTYVGQMSAAGDVEIVVIPDSTSVGGAPITLHASFEVDTHAAPALVVRSSDNRLVVIYSAHGGSTMYRRTSVNTLDSDPTISGGFAAEATAFTGSSMTYPMAFERTAESSSPLYVWFREGITLTYRKSTDGGVTWTSPVSVYADGSRRTYWDIALAADGWRFDFVVTSTTADDDQLGSIYHFFADDEDYKASDGTVIGDPPHSPATGITLVYDEADAGKAWSHDLIYVAGEPAFILGIADGWSPAGGVDTEYRYALWNGSAWDLSTILGSAGAGQFDPMYGCLDQEDPTVAYVIRRISDRTQLWRYVTADGGATWGDATRIASSGAENIYPVAVKDHPTPGLALVWDNGTYVSATDYNLRLMGLLAA